MKNLKKTWGFLGLYRILCLENEGLQLEDFLPWNSRCHVHIWEIKWWTSKQTESVSIGMNFACSMVDSIFSRRFQVSNIFCVHPEPWGNDPIWRLYVSIGLEQKSPTSFPPFSVAVGGPEISWIKTPGTIAVMKKLPGAGQWLLSGRTSGLKPSSSQFEAQLQPLKMGHNEWNELMDGWMNELGGGFKYFFYVHPYLGKILILTNIFQRGWNHQPDEWMNEWTIFGFFQCLNLSAGVHHHIKEIHKSIAGESHQERSLEVT